MMKKWILVAVTLASLSGCQLSNIQLDEALSGLTGTVGATIGTALGGPVIGAAVGVGAAGATVLATPKSTTNNLEGLTPEQKTEVLEYKTLWETIEGWGNWVIAGIAAFFLIPLIIGYFMPNREHRKLRKRAFDDPNTKMDDLK